MAFSKRSTMARASSLSVKFATEMPLPRYENPLAERVLSECSFQHRHVSILQTDLT
jgi:hypothetical protein